MQNNNFWYSGFYWTGGVLNKCPSPGYNSNTGSTSNTDCVACPTGKYANIQGSACYTWADDRYIVDASSTDWSGVCGPGNYISSTHDGMDFFTDTTLRKYELKLKIDYAVAHRVHN